MICVHAYQSEVNCMRVIMWELSRITLYTLVLKIEVEPEKRFSDNILTFDILQTVFDYSINMMSEDYFICFKSSLYSYI